MLGPEGAAAAITAIVEEDLGARMVDVRDRVTAVRLPRVQRELLQPSLIAPFDVLDLPVDAYPAILVIAREMVGLRRLDVSTAEGTAGSTVYACTYPVRVFVWARGQVGQTEPDQRGELADVTRKRLILGVRETLLSRLEFTVTLGAGDDPEEVPGWSVNGTIDLTTLRESYSEVEADDVSTVAAGYVEAEVTLEEAMPAASAGTADTVAPSVHPALA